jgi:hypothetical protein
MSDDKRLPAKIPQTQGPHMPALPTTTLPVNPPTFVTAFVANLQMKVSAHLYKRMNEIATQHLQLQSTMLAIDRVRLDRESALAEWDDIDARIAHEQDGREHQRRLDRARREDDIEEVEHRRRLRRRQEEREEHEHRLAMQRLTTALDPAKAPTENNAVAQARANLKMRRELDDLIREETTRIQQDMTLSPAERDERVMQTRAAISQFAQHLAATGELPEDMRKEMLDAFNRA